MSRARATVLLALATFGLSRRGESQVLLGLLAGGALSSEKFNIGFDIGMNFSTLTGAGDATRKNSALFGLFADWRFAEHVHLGFGLLPISSRGASGLPPRAIGDPALDSLVAGGTMTRSISTVDLPIVLRWAPKRLTGPRVGIGPEFSFVTGASDRYTAVGSSGAPAVVERDIGGPLAGVDAGVALDVEWRWSLLAIGVRYYHGLTDMGLGAGGAASYTRVLSGSGRIPLGRPKAATTPP